MLHWTNGSDETRKLGHDLAPRLRAGDLVTLSGPLGAGKTTFVQGLAAGLGVAPGVTSPTYVLIVEYEGRLPLLHLDAYRLETCCYDAIRDAGVVDLLDREDAVKLVEWPERVVDFLPAPNYVVEAEYGDGADVRIVRIDERVRLAAAGVPPA